MHLSTIGLHMRKPLKEIQFWLKWLSVEWFILLGIGLHRLVGLNKKFLQMPWIIWICFPAQALISFPYAYCTVLWRKAYFWNRSCTYVEIRLSGIHATWIPLSLLLSVLWGTSIFKCFLLLGCTFIGFNCSGLSNTLWFVSGTVPFWRLVGGSCQGCLWSNCLVSSLEQHLLHSFGNFTSWIPSCHFQWIEGYILSNVDCKKTFCSSCFNCNITVT